MIFSIDDRARRNRPALIEGIDGPAWTYGSLASEIERRVEVLRRGEKSLVMLFCRNDFDSVASYLAAIEAGHPVALLDHRLNAELRAGLVAAYRPDCRETPLHPDLALLLSTSGSTGSPKFVRLTRRNIEANAASIREILGITEADIPIAHLPMHYSYGMSVLNSHLLAGAAIVLTNEGLVSPAFWETIRRHRVDSFSGVPYTYQMLKRLGLDQLNVPSLRIMTQAGGKLDDSSTAWFHERMVERGGSFFVMYGQTEASPRMTTLPSGDLPHKLGSAGRAIPGGALSIVDDELVYTGPNVMMGYAAGRADLGKGDELHARLHTGDRARLDGDGFVFILGRARRDAKLFGLRVNLDDVEAMVRAYGPAAAVAGPAGVVIFCEFGNQAEHGEIRDDLAGRLKIHRSGFDLRRIERIPTKASGKVDYDALAAGL